MRALTLLIIFCITGFAQTSTVNESDEDSRDAYTIHYDYDGSDNLEYACKSKSNIGTTSTWTVGSGLTNIVVSTNVGTATTAAAHYLNPGSSITVAGATVDTDLNATYIVATVPSSTTFTITTASVADATYTDAGMNITTTANLLSASVWSVRRYVYDASSNLTQTMWADGNTNRDNACSSPSTLSFY